MTTGLRPVYPFWPNGNGILSQSGEHATGLETKGTRRGLVIINKISQYNGLEFRVFATFTIFKRSLLAEFTVFTVGPIIATISIIIAFTVSTIFAVFRIHPIL